VRCKDAECPSICLGQAGYESLHEKFGTPDACFLLKPYAMRQIYGCFEYRVEELRGF